MDRLTLEGLSMEQLREEAKKCGLPTTKNQHTLIDAIMSHAERHRVEVAAQESQSTVTQTTLETPARVEEPRASSKMEQILALLLQQQQQCWG
ncbi:hypothetical protein KPH14_012228 [Odynerus spinipes]|uniref:SAP domain-containing protein n=1 Tax=Odynerus spinipes TaxID=1348599 RepID=A0AAD9REI6_9HYME|nr:hypothetical protein KPH14_012228 [Odynerus spinipes]